VSTAGYVKLLLPPRQSRGNSYWRLARITALQHCCPLHPNQQTLFQADDSAG
jgi:hypothetical protein